MTIRRWRASDDVTAVLGAAPTWLERQGREAFGHPTATTLVVESDGAAVGVACTYPTRWHPARHWCYVEVAPAHRRSGHASALLAAVRAEVDAPLRAKVSVGTVGEQFALGHGFRPIQRCRTVALPATANGPDVDASPPPGEVAAAFHAFYRATHRWDPLGDVSDDDFRASHVDEALVSLLVRGRDGAAAAVACLYDEEDGTLLFSGGAVDTDEHAARTILAAARRHAHDAGMVLTVEVDDANEAIALEIDQLDYELLDETLIVADG